MERKSEKKAAPKAVPLPRNMRRLLYSDGGVLRRKPAYAALKRLAGERNWNLAEVFYDRTGPGAGKLFPS